MKKDSIALWVLEELKNVCKSNDCNCAIDYELKDRIGFSDRDIDIYLENLSKLGLVKRDNECSEGELIYPTSYGYKINNI